MTSRSSLWTWACFSNGQEKFLSGGWSYMQIFPSLHRSLLLMTLRWQSGAHLNLDHEHRYIADGRSYIKVLRLDYRLFSFGLSHYVKTGFRALSIGDTLLLQEWLLLRDLEAEAIGDRFDIILLQTWEPQRYAYSTTVISCSKQHYGTHPFRSVVRDAKSVFFKRWRVKAHGPGLKCTGEEISGNCVLALMNLDWSHNTILALNTGWSFAFDDAGLALWSGNAGLVLADAGLALLT